MHNSCGSYCQLNDRINDTSHKPDLSTPKSKVSFSTYDFKVSIHFSLVGQINALFYKPLKHSVAGTLTSVVRKCTFEAMIKRQEFQNNTVKSKDLVLDFSVDYEICGACSKMMFFLFFRLKDQVTQLFGGIVKER